MAVFEILGYLGRRNLVAACLRLLLAIATGRHFLQNKVVLSRRITSTLLVDLALDFN